MVQYSGTRNNDYNAMEELLRAALADRFALQAREKAEALAHARPWEHGALHTELLAARLPNVSASVVAERFCRSRGGCTWAEAMVVLSAAHDAGAPAPTSDQRRAAAASTAEMQASVPAHDGAACEAVDAAALDPATFLRRYVRGSRPVVLRGLLDAWAAPQRWTLEYLWERAANSTVKVYASPDGDFEGVRPAHARGARGGPLCAGCGADEEVLLRPAETETSFEHFLWLIRGYANPERASFYLQKHALRKWEAHGLRADASPPPHEKLAPFLRLQHELLWMSTHCTVGPLHYDEQENLHAVVRGAKRFELFHPSAGAAQLYDGTPMRTMYHLWRWDNASRRGHLHALDPLTAPPAHQPFSPVSVRRPDARRHPRFGGAKRLECEVKAGEVLYVPSYWWHEVTSLPQDDALPPASPSAGALPAEIGGGGSAAGAGPRDCGLTASINYFFTPVRRKLSDLVHFAGDPFYDFLSGDERLAARENRWQPAEDGVEVERDEL